MAKATKRSRAEADVITFSSEDGLGAHTWPVAATVYMKPKSFLRLTPAIESDDDGYDRVDSIRAALADGAYIAPPYLKLLRSSNPGAVRAVDTQEGRHRMTAILQVYGNIEVPVELVYEGECKSKTLLSKRDGKAVANAVRRPEPPLKRYPLIRVAAVRKEQY